MKNPPLLGKFYNTDSPVHRLDPRTKLVCIFLAFLMLFFSVTGFMLCTLLVALSLYLANIPISSVTATLKKFLWFYLFTGLFQLFFSKGACLLYIGRTCIITKEGVYNACLITGRFMLLVLISSLLTWSTSSLDITGALKNILSPAEKIGMPTRKFSIMTFLSLRFIPVILDETNRIRKTQKMRGISHESTSILKRFGNLASMVTPLLFCVFKKAENLAVAMESRCFFENSEIKSPTLSFKKNDRLTLLLFLCCTIASFICMP